MENTPCQTNLILFFDEITILADKGNCEEIIDFCKAFDLALHDFLIKNLALYDTHEAQSSNDPAAWQVPGPPSAVEVGHILVQCNVGANMGDSMANNKEDQASRSSVL